MIHWLKTLLIGWLFVYLLTALCQSAVNWSPLALYPGDWSVLARVAWVVLMALWLCTGIGVALERNR